MPYKHSVIPLRKATAAAEAPNNTCLGRCVEMISKWNNGNKAFVCVYKNPNEAVVILAVGGPEVQFASFSLSVDQIF